MTHNPKSNKELLLYTLLISVGHFKFLHPWPGQTPQAGQPVEIINILRCPRAIIDSLKTPLATKNDVAKTLGIEHSCNPV
jgi:hypothetical protein